MTRELWIRGAKRCYGSGAGRGPSRGEGTEAHRRGLWVAAPRPVRPLSHTHPPRGALLGLATVRGLAAAAADPQQQTLLLWLRLWRRPRPSVSIARLPRAPGRCSRARAASARDRARGGTSLKSLRRSHCARAARVHHNSHTGSLGPPRALRTRKTTTHRLPAP